MKFTAGEDHKPSGEGWTYVSPSQLSAFRRCERRWFLRYKERLSDPGSASTVFGTRVHRVTEHHQLSGAWPEAAEIGQIFRVTEIEATRMLRCAQAVRPLLPPGIARVDLVERKLLIQTATPSAMTGGRGTLPKPYEGRIDRIVMPGEDPRDPRLGVRDVKTTSGSYPAKTEHEIREDDQFVVYSEAVFREYPAERSISFQLLYTLTKGKPQGWPVGVVASRDEVAEKFANLHPVVDRMVETYAGTAKASKPNLAACREFGGCPYLGRCAQLGERTMGAASALIAAASSARATPEPISEVSQVSLKDKLAARKAATSTPEAAKVETPPAAEAPTAPIDVRIVVKVNAEEPWPEDLVPRAMNPIIRRLREKIAKGGNAPNADAARAFVGPLVGDFAEDVAAFGWTPTITLDDTDPHVLVVVVDPPKAPEKAAATGAGSEVNPPDGRDMNDPARDVLDKPGKSTAAKPGAAPEADDEKTGAQPPVMLMDGRDAWNVGKKELGEIAHGLQERLTAAGRTLPTLADGSVMFDPDGKPRKTKPTKAEWVAEIALLQRVLGGAPTTAPAAKVETPKAAPKPPEKPKALEGAGGQIMIAAFADDLVIVGDKGAVRIVVRDGVPTVEPFDAENAGDPEVVLDDVVVTGAGPEAYGPPISVSAAIDLAVRSTSAKIAEKADAGGPLLFLDCVPQSRPFVRLSDMLAPYLRDVAKDLGVPHYNVMPYVEGPRRVAAKLHADISREEDPIALPSVIYVDRALPAAAAALEVLLPHAADVITPTR